MEGDKPAQVVVAQPVDAAPVQMQQMAPAPAAGGDVWGPGPLQISQRLGWQQMLEEFTGFEMKNRYDIKGAPVGPMSIHEDSECLQRIFCKNNRALKFHFYIGKGEDGTHMMSMEKDCHWAQSNLPICRPEAQVFDATGNKMGRIHDPCACCRVNNKVFDASDNHIYTVDGTICQCGMCCPLADATLDIIDIANPGADGKIHKKGSCKECFTKANNFEIEFPPNANVNTKGLLLAGIMLVDMEYFEQEK